MPNEHTENPAPEVERKGQRTNIVLFVIGVLWLAMNLRTFLFPPYDRDAVQVAVDVAIWIVPPVVALALRWWLIRVGFITNPEP